MSELLTASRQWATRPNDQRYTSLAELKAAVSARRSESWTAITEAKRLRVAPSADEKGINVLLYDPTKGEERTVEPTNWAFSQLASYAGAPASYLRKIPAALAAINVQWGLENIPVREDVLVLGQTNGEHTLRAMTSQSYGRIWDMQVVEAVEKVNESGIWKVPSASYMTKNPKRATTLYASDRDVFIFLVDDTHPIEVNGEQLFRGFFTYNSEVGAATFGLTTFLYRYICDNRIIWGATEVKELKIRHTGGAPERFGYEGAQYLKRYANEATYQITEKINKAAKFELPTGTGATWDKWLIDRGFTAAQAKQAVSTAKAEEGEARSLWDIVNGVTAYARTIQHTDERVKLETQAGKLLDRLS